MRSIQFSKMHPEIEEGYEEYSAWDREYFEMHPDKEEYMRSPHPAEVAEFMVMGVSNVVAVKVIKVSDGVRGRIPLVPLKVKNKVKAKGFGAK